MLAPLEDDLGIVYLIETAQQFWSELEDILHIPNDNSTTLSRLDSALQRFLSFCATYHQQYLQSPLQLQHACELLLDSELFTFHSERMCDLLVDNAQSNTDPHSQFILYNVLLFYGCRKSNFFRSTKRWQTLIPLLMDHILVEIDPDIEDTYFGITSGAGSNGSVAIPVPIEAKLRSLGVRLLYEVCRVQKLGAPDLRIFDHSFVDHLFDLVEQTRNMQDETFNYSVIKLIAALNEQFMVASLHMPMDSGMTSPELEPVFPDSQPTRLSPESQNRVLRVLMRRLGASKTFGENMIFMLNRANRTAEDLCMQLLILKVLYLLFTNKATSEYFYTNDLCVLVDVFLRELVDLDEDCESLRHTYLRVLHPLLTKTQLRTTPYKRPQIVCALEGLVENGSIRDINPTTKRLVERCLAGEWCVQFRGLKDKPKERERSPTSDVVVKGTSASLLVERTASSETGKEKEKGKTLKTSRSVEPLTATSMSRGSLRLQHNESAISLAVATPPNRREGKMKEGGKGEMERDRDKHHSLGEKHPPHHSHYHPAVPVSASSLSVNAMPVVCSPKPRVPTSISSSPPNQKVLPPRRSAPTPPPKRRKPPAIPATNRNGNALGGGVTITAIKSSASKGLKAAGGH